MAAPCTCRPTTPPTLCRLCPSDDAHRFRVCLAACSCLRCLLLAIARDPCGSPRSPPSVSRVTRPPSSSAVFLIPPLSPSRATTLIISRPSESRPAPRPWPGMLSLSRCRQLSQSSRPASDADAVHLCPSRRPQVIPHSASSSLHVSARPLALTSSCSDSQRSRQPSAIFATFVHSAARVTSLWFSSETCTGKIESLITESKQRCDNGCSMSACGAHPFQKRGGTITKRCGMLLEQQ